jgi:TonB-dependent receptor
LIGGYSLNLTEASRLSLKTLATQSAEDETRQVTGPFDQSTSGFAFINRQQFVERTLVSTKLKGEHKLGILGGAKLEWDGSYAVALRDEPDTRESAYLRPFAEEGVFGFNEAGNNSRFFSELTDHMTQGGLELSGPLTLLGREATLDTGLRGGWRTRDFAARRFSYESPRAEFRQVPAEELFTTENVAAGNIRFFENTEPNDEYEATELSSSAFASLGMSLADPLWLTAGLRVEQNDTEVDSFDPRSGDGVEALSADLATVELLPTVNLQWSLGERQSVRLAAARTIVRPQFRELAPFRYDDYLESTFGNPFLENGEVYNFDLRWSLFPAVGEIVTVGAFYKQFNDPIEIVRIPTAGNNVGSPEPYNGPSARNYGVELELRHDLSNLSGALRGLGLSANAAFVESEVEQDEPVEVFFGSVSGSGPDILEPEVFTNSSRPMYGQSPYLVNASLYYTTPGSGTTATLLYNGVGKRLAQVGTNGFDDIFELDRHSFDVALEQSLFNAMTARLALENLTDAVYRFRLGEFTTREYKKGRKVSLKLSYAF